MEGFQPQSWNWGDVGIFHETYLVPEGQYECVYNNMPTYGLAKAGAHVPATGVKKQAGGLAAKENQPFQHPESLVQGSSTNAGANEQRIQPKLMLEC